MNHSKSDRRSGLAGTCPNAARKTLAAGLLLWAALPLSPAPGSAQEGEGRQPTLRIRSLGSPPPPPEGESEDRDTDILTQPASQSRPQPQGIGAVGTNDVSTSVSGAPESQSAGLFLHLVSGQDYLDLISHHDLSDDLRFYPIHGLGDAGDHGGSRGSSPPWELHRQSP